MRAMRALALGLCLSACAAPHQIVDRTDFLAEATRIYSGETTERVIEAAQRVLKQSDPGNVEIRNTLNGFTALRPFVIYLVLSSARGSEKWDFTADRDATGGVRAGLTVSETGEVYSITSTPQHADAALASVPLYRLFWSRVDYVLGHRENWPTCEGAEADLRATNTNTVTALGGLCGPTSGGRNAQPPERLPVLPPTSALKPVVGPGQARAGPK
jgi:hypothetical protein